MDLFKSQILGVSNFCVLEPLTTALNHETCINTSVQALKKTLFAINALCKFANDPIRYQIASIANRVFFLTVQIALIANRVLF